MELGAYTLLAASSLFAILSPFATVPAFLTITEHDTEADRLRMARRACLVAFCVLAVFSLVGTWILEALKVSIPALRIAGGLVILRVAFEMLQDQRRQLSAEESEQAREKQDVAITPLAIPMLCGPGTITTGVVLGSQAASPLHYAALIASGAAIYAMTYSLFLLAVRYSAVLGPIGLRVVGRLFGLLLAAIAVEFLVGGLREALPRAFG
jgi:multiple antibiotic resistance protein